MVKSLLLVTLFALAAIYSRASHVMGGEITWTCQNGNVVFELVFYRDCNGAEVNTVSETIKVWNHPTLTEITVNFVSRTDISPFCNPVLGSPPQLTCGTGSSGGNGIGAIEKIVYRSAPLTLTGTPPAAGWIFTCDNFARSASITNLTDAGNFGITLAAYMFSAPAAGTTCIDQSPRFLQDPYLVSCAGNPYLYNMNPVDPDLDSIVVSFGKPLNNFQTGSFNPPTNPIELAYEAGFSFDSPTPGTSLNAANIPASVNPQTGEINFTSFTTGNFVIKLVVQSYRNGQLTAQVEREIQVIVQNCLPTNTAPTINGPFGGLFETTVTAGDLVNFNLVATDLELLQDGSPQSNYLSASGPMFGTNFTQNTGCAIAPCATLNSAPLISGTQGVSANFNWQTSCDHLVNGQGIAVNEMVYNFVFKVQDDYCQIPKVSYKTITIKVQNPGVIEAPSIDCITTQPDGTVQVSWTPVTDPFGSFVSYELHSVQNGLLQTINTITTNTVSLPAINDQHDFFLTVRSGCAGNTLRYSDTVSNIFLELFNPANGTAVLTWNNPITGNSPTFDPYYYIYREYPVGTWILFDSVPYGTTQFRDTIDICETPLSYQIVLPTASCSFTSNIEGDVFEDMMTPDIPVISYVTIDTLTGETTIVWNENNEPDTYGYVIYQADDTGILIEIDTVFGITNTSYTFDPVTTGGALTFSVAAFDSCFTDLTPPTYQTSAKSPLHVTHFLTTSYSVCDQLASLSWTAYQGWDAVASYRIFGRENGGPWTLFGTTNQLNFDLAVNGLSEYVFVIEATHTSGKSAFSNLVPLSAVAPTLPSYHYTRVATVENGHVLIRHYIDPTAGVAEILIEKKNLQGQFSALAKIPVTAAILSFVDTEVDTDRRSYEYRVRIIDSCGNPGAAANTVRTVLLQVTTDEVRMINHLYWTPYATYDGSVLEHHLYRGIDGVFEPLPIAVLNSETYFFEDYLEDDYLITGKVCYFVEAVEAVNQYGFQEKSRSNVACPVFDPLIFIPNAFTPGGLNPIFKPVISLADPNDYEFTVLNRWGQIVFQTRDMNQGWNGEVPISGQIGETAVYLYVLKVKDGNGQEVTRRGFVTLLK